MEPLGPGAQGLFGGGCPRGALGCCYLVITTQGLVTAIRYTSRILLLTHPDRNTQNERRATQSNTRQRTQGKQNQRSRNNTSKPKTNTADPEHYSKPPTTENRILRTNRKPLPSKPPPKAYLNHTVQANQTCQGPPWILPASPVSSGGVQPVLYSVRHAVVFPRLA